MKAKKLEEWDSIEREFFKIDEEEKTAKIVMQYDSAEDWIDSTCLTDTPLINTEVLDQIRSVFGLAPRKYKVDLTLRFNDFGPYTETQMADILKKNLIIELKGKVNETRQRDRTAVYFIIAGLLSFLFMFLMRSALAGDTMWDEFFFYLFDIITTVSLYEAVTILFLEKKEKLAEFRNLLDSVSAIHFEKNS